MPSSLRKLISGDKETNVGGVVIPEELVVPSTTQGRMKKRIIKTRFDSKHKTHTDGPLAEFFNLDKDGFFEFGLFLGHNIKKQELGDQMMAAITMGKKDLIEVKEDDVLARCAEAPSNMGKFWLVEMGDKPYVLYDFSEEALFEDSNLLERELNFAVDVATDIVADFYVKYLGENPGVYEFIEDTKEGIVIKLRSTLFLNLIDIVERNEQVVDKVDTLSRLYRTFRDPVLGINSIEKVVRFVPYGVKDKYGYPYDKSGVTSVASSFFPAGPEPKIPIEEAPLVSAPASVPVLQPLAAPTPQAGMSYGVVDEVKRMGDNLNMHMQSIGNYLSAIEEQNRQLIELLKGFGDVPTYLFNYDARLANLEGYVDGISKQFERFLAEMTSDSGKEDYEKVEDGEQ